MRDTKRARITDAQCSSSVFEPRVMRGRCVKWRACSRWRDVSEMLGGGGDEEEVEVMVSNDNEEDAQVKSFYGDLGRRKTTRMKFRDWIEYCKSEKLSTEEMYLAQAPIMANAGDEAPASDDKLQWLAKDICIDEVLKDVVVKDVAEVNLWMSRAGSMVSTSCHHDNYNNVLCVVTGEKRIKLVPPSHIYELNAMTAWGEDHCHCRGRIADLVAQSSAARASLFACTLCAGDALFIPAGWLHEVESGVNGEHTIAVNFWFRDDFNRLLFPRDNEIGAEMMAQYWARRAIQMLIEHRVTQILEEKLLVSVDNILPMPSVEFMTPTRDERQSESIARYIYNARPMMALILLHSFPSSCARSAFLASVRPIEAEVLTRQFDRVHNDQLDEEFDVVSTSGTTTRDGRRRRTARDILGGVGTYASSPFTIETFFAELFASGAHAINLHDHLCDQKAAFRRNVARAVLVTAFGDALVDGNGDEETPPV